MAIPNSNKLDSLIEESEKLNYEFKSAIQSKNLEAFFKGHFFELSPMELRVLPDFSNSGRRMQLFRLIQDCITEVDNNIFCFIETDEHVRRYLNGVLIKIERIKRKLNCFFLGNLSGNDKDIRLADREKLSMLERTAYIIRANLPVDPTVQLPPEMQWVGTSTNGTLLLHLHITMKYVFSCNHIEEQYERLLRHVIEQNEKFNPSTINFVKKDITRIFPETPLKLEFKDGNKYDEIIQVLIDNRAILNNNDVLIWKGFRGNRKIDVVAFCEVLFKKGLLHNRVDNFKTMKPILSSTFLDFEISRKSFINKDSYFIQRQFEQLLSSF